MATVAQKPETNIADFDASRESVTRRAVKVGLIGGIGAVYLCMVGIVPRFEDREVIAGVINLGRTMLLLAFLTTGYFAARPVKTRPGEPEPPAPAPGTGLMAGVVSGAIAGGLTAVLLLLADAIDMRSVFVAVGPGLVEILAFGQSVAVGLLLLIAFAVVSAVVAAGVHLLTPDFRIAVLAGFGTMLSFSLFSTLVSELLEGTSEYVPLALLDDTGWLYEGDGLTVIGAILVFAGTAAFAHYRARSGGIVKRRVEALPAAQKTRAKLVGFLLLGLFLLILPQIAGRFVSDVLGTIGIYILLGLGLNIVVGFAGLLDLGYVAFFAIGAYGTAMFTSEAAFTGGDLNFWVAVPVVLIITTALGVLIGAPVLRLRGDYLAIVTLGFGEIVRVLVISEWLRPWTGGAQGILGIPDPDIGVELPLVGGPELGDPQSLYYLILIFCIGAAFVAYRLQDSRIGRAWVAMREDEQVAEAMGISIIKTKLLAFAMGAAIGSFGGMFFAVKIGSVFPNSMVLLVSIVVLALIVLGGMGSIPGVVVGAIVLVGLPEILREFVEYRLLVYGAVLVAIMILRPEGLVPSARRRLELHEEEAEEMQFELRHGEDVDTGAPVVTARAGDEAR
jgi:branched-chain amino acid transport system permease protein